MLQHVIPRAAMPGTPVRPSTEPQLLVQMPLLDGEAVGGPGRIGAGAAPPRSAQDPLACANECVRRLMRILQGHCEDHLRAKVCGCSCGQCQLHKL